MKDTQYEMEESAMCCRTSGCRCSERKWWRHVTTIVKFYECHRCAIMKNKDLRSEGREVKYFLRNGRMAGKKYACQAKRRQEQNYWPS
ncbi:jg5254 [Pararge aegeria aegeria]|uniref:Jg5254 protein n=1 Tax=Pararge aegeria aegeria TaxID=348720 RepID=A0A8S4QQC3_9NEOP|nr:jg5254 [Pararge aegeria aegeria]